jgi:3',5'-cyclic AMP phosphodiesterase CpdA
MQCCARRCPNTPPAVHSHDGAHDAAETTYARVRAAIAAHYQGPILWLPGNHDLAAPLDRERPGARELRLGEWQIIAIDTHLDGAEGGNVGGVELDRLRELLARTAPRFVVVAGHHPPMKLGTPWLDSGSIANGAALLELLSGSARVKAYVCGHVHQETATTHRGVRVVAAPASPAASKRSGPVRVPPETGARSARTVRPRVNRCAVNGPLDSRKNQTQTAKSHGGIEIPKNPFRCCWD